VGLLGDASVIPALVALAREGPDDEDSPRARKKSLASSALSALSTLEGDVGVPALIDFARSGSVSTRREAVFWLGQNGDPRALRMVRSVIEDASEATRVRAHAIFSLSQGKDTPESDFAYLRRTYSRLAHDELKEAVLHGMTQDEDEGGRWLIERAMDSREPTRLRKTALFWAGQADATPTADLVRVYRESTDNELREHAIFVLSQRRDDAATDALMGIAREDRDRSMRGKALFWLAQKKDPRVTKLIAELLLK
jgi:HEAT repeat protein